MTKQRIDFINYLKLSGFSKSTIQNYVNAVALLARRYNRKPNLLNEQEIINFFVELRDQGKSDKRVAMVYYGIRKYYLHINQEYKIKKIPTPKRVYHIPLVLSKNEVNLIISSSDGVREKIITNILYSSGIRIGELANLKLKDFDFDRKTLYISKPKNRKPRYVILSDNTIEILKYYISVYNPKSYLLFPNNQKENPLSTRMIQRIISKIIKRSNLSKKITAHTLRHSFATHLLENGCNIINIQRLLGHANIGTTALYLHVESSTFLSVKSPISQLDQNVTQPGFFLGQLGFNYQFQSS